MTGTSGLMCSSWDMCHKCALNSSCIKEKLLSAINMILSILALTYRYMCSTADLPYQGSDYFIVTVIRTYIMKYDCRRAMYVEDITKANSIFVLSVILLVLSFINVFMAAASISDGHFNFIYMYVLILFSQLLEFNISVVSRGKPVKNYDVPIYVYVATNFAMFVVDLTFSVHFGMDHETMKGKLDNHSAGSLLNYENDMIRLGAMLFMTIALKGYIGHLINIVLLILLMYYIIQYQQRVYEEDLALRSLGVINAFESSNGFEETYSPQRATNLTSFYSRRPSMNGLNSIDEESPRQAPMRETSFIDNLPLPSPPKQFEDPWVPMYRYDPRPGPLRSGQSNLAYNSSDPNRLNIMMKESSTSDRIRDSSNSWLHNSGAARPFSYLEDPKRPVPVKSPSAAVPEPQWRRDAWPPAPPVPDPDYSPPPRRLKSALKSNYI
ncbi:uncharacterized protein LOC112047836 [Bicyclus anynana]|uniref:Uncharacterized protein LOC112047836 n=1 Tax=Bicyclus anynana TaxID=110368 RepID=A0ABM3M6S9_BICAN|nr:uncharacterized protein LOC112047836 [Bicyclus anynana]